MKEVKKVSKKVKTFETQKLVKKLKDARYASIGQYQFIKYWSVLITLTGNKNPTKKFKHSRNSSLFSR